MKSKLLIKVRLSVCPGHLFDPQGQTARTVYIKVIVRKSIEIVGFYITLLLQDYMYIYILQCQQHLKDCLAVKRISMWMTQVKKIPEVGYSLSNCPVAQCGITLSSLLLECDTTGTQVNASTLYYIIKP